MGAPPRVRRGQQVHDVERRHVGAARHLPAVGRRGHLPASMASRSRTREAQVLPALLHDHLDAVTDGLGLLGVVRVAPLLVEQLVGDVGEEGAHPRDPVGPGGQHLVVRRDLGRGEAVAEAERVEVLGAPPERALAEPDVAGVDEVAQRLGEGPLAVDLLVDGAGRQGRGARDRRVPGVLDRSPRLPQARGIRGPPQRPAGEAPVELALDERDDVDAVDHQRLAERQPGRVDLHAGDLRPADDDVGEVGLDEPRAAQVLVPELARLAGHEVSVGRRADRPGARRTTPRRAGCRSSSRRRPGRCWRRRRRRRTGRRRRSRRPAAPGRRRSSAGRRG